MSLLLFFSREGFAVTQFDMTATEEMRYVECQQ